MRLLNKDTDEKLDRVIIYLTKAEAEELRDGIENVISDPIGNHAHVYNKDFKKEITVCIYDENNIDKHFDLRSIKLIKEDK